MAQTTFHAELVLCSDLTKNGVGARGEPFAQTQAQEDIIDPYQTIADLREDFQDLESVTIDADSRRWLQNLFRNLDTLEERVDDIRVNLDEGGH